MNEPLTRRSFIKKTALAVAAAGVSDLCMTFRGTVSGRFAALAAGQGAEENPVHVGIAMWPGRSEETRQQLAHAVAEAVVNIMGCSEGQVSVAIEEVASSDWKEQIYDPRIRGKKLYKQPGYSM